MEASEIAQYAYAAGFRGYDLVVAVAVAMGESGGNPQAVGDKNLTNSTWGPSVGLWQIRTLKAQTGTGQTRDIHTATDPMANARSAFQLYMGRNRGFRDWTIYNNGSYRNHLGAVTAAIKGLGGDIANVPAYVPGQGIPGGPMGAEGTKEGPQLPTEEEVNGVFRDVLGIVPSGDQLARYTGKTLKQTTGELNKTDKALDWSMQRGLDKMKEL